MHGASKEDIEKLLVLYPDIPDSLLQLLEIVDGTYWRKYAEKEVALLVLGSDMEEYPYYLLSAQQMVDTKDNSRKWGDYLITREFDHILVDEGVCDDMDKLCLLHFSDCMNNGGISQLFIDFFPSAKGKKGKSCAISTIRMNWWSWQIVLTHYYQLSLCSFEKWNII